MNPASAPASLRSARDRPPRDAGRGRALASPVERPERRNSVSPLGMVAGVVAALRPDRRSRAARPGAVRAGGDRRLALAGGLGPLVRRALGRAGRVVRFLGGGEVCSEYVSLLCRDGAQQQVAAALADWLAQPSAGDGPEPLGCAALSGVEPDDSAVGRLLDRLGGSGHLIERQPGLNCWRLAARDLGALSGDALEMPSQAVAAAGPRLLSQRPGGRALGASPRRLGPALAILVELHQRRWRKRGQAGCFASRRFHEFHREVAGRLLPQDGLLMNWLELDGHPIAAEYHLAGAGIVYAYQSGIDPDGLSHQPGRLSNLAAIRRAIERGDRFFDFLRGDEPYKAHCARRRGRRTMRSSFPAGCRPGCGITCARRGTA